MLTYHREVDPKVKVGTANIVYFSYIHVLFTAFVHLIVLVSAVHGITHAVCIHEIFKWLFLRMQLFFNLKNGYISYYSTASKYELEFDVSFNKKEMHQE